MALERSSVNIVSQLGVETTPGTAVAATFLWAALETTLNNEFDIQEGRSSGSKYTTTSVIHRAWATGEFSGPLLYTELHALLAGYTGCEVGAQIGTTGAYPWTATPTTRGEDTGRKAFTLRHGDSSAIELLTHLQINGLEINFETNGATVKAPWFAKEVSQSGSLTSSIDQLPNVQVARPDVLLYVDSAGADVGDTLFAKAFSAKLKLGELLMPVFYLGARSFNGIAEKAAPGTLEIIVPHDSASRSLYNALVAGENIPRRFIRIASTGPNIGVSADYLIQADVSCAFRSAKPEKDKDGVYAYSFQFAIEHDEDWGKPWEIKVVNKQSAL